MTTGIFALDADEYHADQVADQPSLSSSIARILIDKTPLHAWAAHPKLGAQASKDTDATNTGTILHSLILEDDTLTIRIIDADDWRTKDARAHRDAARADGCIPVRAKDWRAIRDTADAITARIRAHDAKPALFTNGRAEQTIVWDEGGVTCRARLDWLRDDHATIDDLKTTKMSVHPNALARTVFTYGYDVQAAFYLRGLKALTGKTADFRFVFAEIDPPNAITVINLSPAALALANEKVQWAIDTWRECLRTNTWPGYPQRVATLDPPAWAEAQWLDRDLEAA